MSSYTPTSDGRDCLINQILPLLGCETRISPFGLNARNRAPGTLANTEIVAPSGTVNMRSRSNGEVRHCSGTATFTGTFAPAGVADSHGVGATPPRNKMINRRKNPFISVMVSESRAFAYDIGIPRTPVTNVG